MMPIGGAEGWLMDVVAYQRRFVFFCPVVGSTLLENRLVWGRMVGDVGRGSHKLRQHLQGPS